MPPGSWLAYGAPWDEAAPAVDPCNRPFRKILSAWNGWARDGLRYIYVAASGGHSDGCDNGVYRYDIQTGHAELITPHVELNAGDSTWMPYVADENGIQILPRSSHTGSGQFLDGDWLYQVIGSVWRIGHTDRQVWRYHVVEKRWERLPNRIDEFDQVIGRGTPIMVKTPDGPVLVGHNICNVDLAAGRYDCQNILGAGEGSTVAWDPVRNGIWHLDPGVGVFRFLRRSGGIWRVDDSLSGVIPDDIGVGLVKYAGICVVPDQGILMWSKSADLYLWDGNAWSVVRAPDGPPSVETRLVINKWSWDDEAQVCVGGSRTDEGLWVYKPANSSLPPPDPVPDPDPSISTGDLTHDGPATPEQISLYLPVTGVLPATATATVRYKQAGSQTWTTGHPLFRIHPGFSTLPAQGSVLDAFAWPIIDLEPGVSYDVEVTVTSGSVSAIKTANFTTRALPVSAGTPSMMIFPGDDIQGALNNLNPGDVLELQNGTYNVDGLILGRSGTLDNPIYIRGESQDGVVLSDPTGIILYITDTSNIIIENMTLRGSGIDSSTTGKSRSRGIGFYNRTPNQNRVTIRNVTINGVDMGIVAWKEISGFLAYGNTLIGNNTWTTDFFDTSITWNDDGIRIPGFGNAAFNNTLTGFGDALAYAHHSGGSTVTQSVGVHFYRNDVRNSGDDFAEIDHGQRNLTLYDNRSTNSMTFISLDPLYGGPLVVARNIAINVGRSPFKWNSKNSGQFVYNNTVIRTTGRNWVMGGVEAGWNQPNNGAQQVYGYQNNILVYRGPGDQTIRLDNSGHDIVDFTHNSWYPDLVYQWPEGRFNDLADALNRLSTTTPVFSGITRRHEMDNITVSNPWTIEVVLGVDYRSEVMTAYTPGLSPGTMPKNSGVVIPNITDGFDGTAPDRGAIIAGRPTPLYGDR